MIKNAYTWITQFLRQEILVLIIFLKRERSKSQGACRVNNNTSFTSFRALMKNQSLLFLFVTVFSTYAQNIRVYFLPSWDYEVPALVSNGDTITMESSSAECGWFHTTLDYDSVHGQNFSIINTTNGDYRQPVTENYNGQPFVFNTNNNYFIYADLASYSGTGTISMADTSIGYSIEHASNFDALPHLPKKGCMKGMVYDWDVEDFPYHFNSQQRRGMDSANFIGSSISFHITNGLVKNIVKNKIGNFGLPVPNEDFYNDPTHDVVIANMVNNNFANYYTDYTADQFYPGQDKSKFFKDIPNWFQPNDANDNTHCEELILAPMSNNVFEFNYTTSNPDSSKQGFFPIDEHKEVASDAHNYNFCMHVSNTFEFEKNQVFAFTGDDDLWVFIEDSLVLDMGGTHNEANGSITLNDLEGSLGLVEGNEYRFDLFYCERQKTGSNLRIQTNMVFKEDQEYSAINRDGYYQIQPYIAYAHGCNQDQIISAKSKFDLIFPGSDTLNITPDTNPYIGGVYILDSSSYRIVADSIYNPNSELGDTIYLKHTSIDDPSHSFEVPIVISMIVNDYSLKILDIDDTDMSKPTYAKTTEIYHADRAFEKNHIQLFDIWVENLFNSKIVSTNSLDTIIFTDTASLTISKIPLAEDTTRLAYSIVSDHVVDSADIIVSVVIGADTIQGKIHNISFEDTSPVYDLTIMDSDSLDMTDSSYTKSTFTVDPITALIDLRNLRIDSTPLQTWDSIYFEKHDAIEITMDTIADHSLALNISSQENLLQQNVTVKIFRGIDTIQGIIHNLDFVDLTTLLSIKVENDSKEDMTLPEHSDTVEINDTLFANIILEDYFSKPKRLITSIDSIAFGLDSGSSISVLGITKSDSNTTARIAITSASEESKRDIDVTVYFDGYSISETIENLWFIDTSPQYALFIIDDANTDMTHDGYYYEAAIRDSILANLFIIDRNNLNRKSLPDSIQLIHSDVIQSLTHPNEADTLTELVLTSSSIIIKNSIFLKVFIEADTLTAIIPDISFLKPTNLNIVALDSTGTLMTEPNYFNNALIHDTLSFNFYLYDDLNMEYVSDSSYSYKIRLINSHDDVKVLPSKSGSLLPYDNALKLTSTIPSENFMIEIVASNDSNVVRDTIPGLSFYTNPNAIVSAELHDLDGNGKGDQLIISFERKLTPSTLMKSINACFGSSDCALKNFPVFAQSINPNDSTQLIFPQIGISDPLVTSGSGNIEFFWEHYYSDINAPGMIQDKMGPVIKAASFVGSMDNAELTIQLTEPFTGTYQGSPVHDFLFTDKQANTHPSIFPDSYTLHADSNAISFKITNAPNTYFPGIAHFVQIQWAPALLTDNKGNPASPGNIKQVITGHLKLDIDTKGFAIQDKEVLDSEAFKVIGHKDLSSGQHDDLVGFILPGDFGQFVRTDLPKNPADIDLASLQLKVYSYYFGDEGSYINNDETIVSCNDVVFNGNCMTYHHPILYSWNGLSNEGRKVGNGVFIGKMIYELSYQGEILQLGETIEEFGFYRKR